MPNLRTDLAMENISDDMGMPGVEIRRWQQGDIEMTEVLIRTEQAARQMGKPEGSYLTMECNLLRQHDPDVRIAMSALLGEELSRLMAQHSKSPVLVVGLGNRDVTPDSLGPATAEKILVTRHIMSSSFAPDNLHSVCAIAPGVLGVTGVETMELVEGLVQKIQPGAVVCIDSLAARSSRRIGCTVQISSTGIQPGSGVGNHRKPLTKETLGVDVIAIGVPTVIFAATLARDAFALLAGEDNQEEALQDMEQELLGTDLGNLIVTPRDIDAIVKNCAMLIAGGINRALQNCLSDEQIAQMMD